MQKTYQCIKRKHKEIKKKVIGFLNYLFDFQWFNLEPMSAHTKFLPYIIKLTSWTCTQLELNATFPHDSYK